MKNAFVYLDRYRLQYNEMEKVMHQIDALIASAQAITYNENDTPIQAGISDKTGAIAAEIADLKMLYKDQSDALIKIRHEIMQTINELPATYSGSLQSSLLVRRYIGMQRWNEIADELHISEEYARGKLHRKALDEVERIINREE